MALFSYVILFASLVCASSSGGEMAVVNVTRFSEGDLFTITGTDCGPTRCMEVSHGTALSAALASDNVGCVCQCSADTPAFREDQRLCINHIEECEMASFGRGATKPQIPYVFLPLKGLIIYPSKEIIFTDVEDAICAVTNAQYLSASGWMTLRDLVDNDVPFSLYRDKGKTFLKWRGSMALHARLEGRLVAAHVVCSAPSPTRLAASCAAFRVAGASHTPLLDVRSIPFHAGETVTSEPTTQSQGLSVLESLAIGVCVLMLVFVYAAGIVFYIHYKQRQRKKNKDVEMNNTNTLSTDNGSTLDSRIDMESLRMKTNPLLQLDSLTNSFLHDNGLSDVSEHTEDTIDSSPTNTHKFQKCNVISAMVHTRRKKPSRPTIRTSTPDRLNERLQRRSASPDALECAPHSDLSIIDCSIDENAYAHQQTQSTRVGEHAIRRKLYFNPVFFETEHLKSPPPAAVEFLIKIREVMSIAKDKMTSKRFIPILSDIPEEELYHTVDLGWDIPCARRGRRFSAISLKRENSRRAVQCGGCPGCDSSDSREQKITALTRSNSCKTCVSDDYKQKIVRKWLDEVPAPVKITRPIKSVAKVSGTPRIVDQKKEAELPIITAAIPQRKEEANILKSNDVEIKESMHRHNKRDSTFNKGTRKDEIITKSRSTILENLQLSQGEVITKISETVPLPKKREPPTVTDRSPIQNTKSLRNKLPPPPPPPICPPLPLINDEAEEIAPEVKKNMEAVIRELNKCKRAEPKVLEEIKTEKVDPIIPKIVIPVVAADSQYYSDDNTLSDRRKRDIYNQNDKYGFENSMLKKRRFSVACGPELEKNGSAYNINSESYVQMTRERLSRSWRDVRKAMGSYEIDNNSTDFSLNLEHQSLPVSEIIVNTSEPLYNNVLKPGPLTIQVRGSPVENRRKINEEFDPDTLDRKPKKEAKKRVDKILLKSGGSFKFKSNVYNINEQKSPPESSFSRKIGSLRQIYEAKAKAHEEEVRRSLYQRRGSTNSYDSDDIAAFVRSIKTPDIIRQTENHKDPKPPIPPKQKRGGDLSPKFANPSRESPHGDRRLRSPEDRERISQYRPENINARRSGRRSTRTRSRRTDLRKLYRTEDSGYLSTDSNESKRRARYLLQLHPRTSITEKALPTPIPISRPLPLQIESDTDDLESLCDGRSESGGESVETDSVFFGNFDDSKQLFAELGLCAFEPKSQQNSEQIDSGFAGETNIVLSGDSDSEHRSVISIVADCDGRASSASVSRLDDPPYMQSIEC